ncbi:MAG: adenylate/guanylate cyclase domain-containing protein [Pseudomonadota bacterium]
MTRRQLDPAPRRYTSGVMLRRRGEARPDDVARLGKPDLETWLLNEAADEDDLLALFQAFAWRMVAAGLPVQRVGLSIGTLHPQLVGYSWNWNSADGFCDELEVDESVLASDAYRLNPIFQVIDRGEPFRARTDIGDGANQSPLLKELAEQGIVEYAALPMPAGSNVHNAVTIATKQPGGFTDAEFTAINHYLRLLALHVQKHIALRISENIVTTYLGSAAGRQVLHGSIKHGSGQPIDAIIWASDMRGFTDLAARLTERDMIAVLDAYFDRLAGSVMAEGGEVLKFIGDGLLAVFPFSRFVSEGDAASAAVSAAQDALSVLEQLNEDESQLSDVDGWRPLKTGIALHRGEVFFGNVGAPERLDFTVIGRAVNAVSRVEGLCKSLDRPILITQRVADLIDLPLDDLGAHALRGFAEPLAIYAPQAR